ncbi:putative membrane protein [Wickerhamomyces ciferrii]|uniref:Membrane protein n=1 Tax=Wickerhamomyces ciferrii (strain ATCC 14091 / BCRC 22168 / CBS 111 / JCM 3599 / NBRC 0793 / NRRL Y-1031 F-60-10) TaxID=1206466 RepID=K0KX84_WICCF|nr:uncharacterized protein BN7_5682 [Wickerhamomyces ciferrii]CCH46094.1 putative membrane protein [Wickerhamomyces ciferrii]
MSIETIGSPFKRDNKKAREFYKNLKAVLLGITIITLISLGLINLFELPNDSNKNKVSQLQDALETYKPENLQIGEYADIGATLSTDWKVFLGVASVALYCFLGAGFIGKKITLGLARWTDYVLGAVFVSEAVGMISYGAYYVWLYW